MKIGRWLVFAGSVILFLTALLHGSGYPSVSGAIEQSGAKPLVVSAFKALWVMLSFHLIVLSAVFTAASRSPHGRNLVLLCSLIPLSDTALLFHFLGVFIGTISLALATVFFLVGGYLLPHSAKG